MTILYLGLSTGDVSAQLNGLANAKLDGVIPSVLISFYYLPTAEKQGMWNMLAKNKKMLDSGAYSVKESKVKINIDSLLNEINTNRWDEVVALDVIGDPIGTAKNAEYMAARTKKPLITTFHFGEPWEFLTEYARRYDKIGLGGTVTVREKKEKLAWWEQCFSRVWPKKIHLFGNTSREVLMRFPFHSADSTSWEMNSLCFGRYSFANNQNLGLNRSMARATAGKGWLRPEAQLMLRSQAELYTRWSAEFKKLGWV